MTLLQALLLGILQGLTEFLPVSSSGHLVLAQLLFDVQVDPIDLQALNILLHTGTLLALLLVYAQTWITLLRAPFANDKEHALTLVLLIIATIPGACIGLLFDDVIARTFHSLPHLAAAFFVTGVVLLVGEKVFHRKKNLLQRLLHPSHDEPHKLTTRSALFLGMAQACALIPGISRSGITISSGRALGLDRKDALNFSFLMAMPIIAGASAMSLLDLFSGTLFLPAMPIVFTAITASFITSIVAILFLRSFVSSRSLAWFSPYLFALSLLCIFFVYT